jgi:hypothetical protein
MATSRSVPPGIALQSGKEALFTGEIGVSVCGVGNTTGYGTGFASGNGTYQASSVTLRTLADATPDLLKSEISTGTIQVVGNTTVDDQAAIELSVVPPTADQAPSNWGSETLWVDPTTYLPIQQVIQYTAQIAPSGAPPFPTPSYGGEQTLEFTFLQPTLSNLALLQVSVPSSLPQVPAPQVLPAGACTALAGR